MCTYQEDVKTASQIEKPEVLTERMWRQLSKFFFNNTQRVVELVELFR